MSNNPTYNHINTIILLICKEFNITYYSFSSKTRTPGLVRARALFSKILRNEEASLVGKKISLAGIGEYIGRSHCDVIHLLKNHDKYMADWGYKRIFLQLSKQNNKEILKEKIKYHEDQLIELNKLLAACE